VIVYLTLIWLVNGQIDPHHSASLSQFETMTECLDFAEGYARDNNKTIGVDLDYICDPYISKSKD
jgi:hypothetical protein